MKISLLAFLLLLSAFVSASPLDGVWQTETPAEAEYLQIYESSGVIVFSFLDPSDYSFESYIGTYSEDGNFDLRPVLVGHAFDIVITVEATDINNLRWGVTSCAGDNDVCAALLGRSYPAVRIL